MIIVDNIEQGSLEWIMARLWRLTASNYKKVITSTGKLSTSQAAKSYIDTLIAGYMIDEDELRKASDSMNDWEMKQWLSHYVGDTFAGSIHTERGHEYEAEAIAKVSDFYGIESQQVGMCIMGNNPNGVISCSPDALVFEGGRPVAGVEVKNTCLKTYLGQVRNCEVDSDYLIQVHGSMAACDLDVWYFGSNFHGFPVLPHKVERNKLTDTIQESLIQFPAVYESQYLEIKNAVEALAGEEAA